MLISAWIAASRNYVTNGGDIMTFNPLCIPVFTYIYYALLLILSSLPKISSEMESSVPPKKQCLKTEYYYSFNNSCLPCSICNNSSDVDFHEDECKKKNPNELVNGLFLYCNMPNGPFTVDFAVTRTISTIRTDSTTQTVITDNNSTLSADTVSEAADLTKPVVIGTLSAVAVVLTLGILAAVVIKWRKCRFSRSPVLPAEKACGNGTEATGVLLTIAQEDDEQNAQENQNPCCEKACRNGTEATGVLLTIAQEDDEQNTQENQNPCCDKRSCCSAFKALINNRAVLIELATLFDRDYAPDMVTWHSLAMGLLELDPARVVHKEYVARPALSECPSHGPTFSVLHEMYCKGLCLQDLLNWLQRSEQHKRFNAGRALEILRPFSDSLSANDLFRGGDHRAV